MPGDGVRALARDVFFYDLQDPATLLGGLVLTPGITNTNFYSMVEIVLVIPGNYFLQTGDGSTLPRDSQSLLPGNYFVVLGLDGTVSVNDEMVVTRAVSLGTGTRLREFRDEKDEDFGRWITLPTSRGEEINSVQNGLLLYAGVHASFDHFEFSINPDDDCKIVCFIPDVHGIAGTALDRRLLDDARRPAPELLRWHFRQAVLANMRGAGKPIFEHDFPPGSDIMGDIRAGPKASDRMEFEMFGRLGAHMKLD